MKEEKLYNMRHSCSHLLAAAVQRLWPDVKLGIGPVIENGFYYDFDLKHRLSDDDLAKIETEMHRIAGKNLEFEKQELTIEEAGKLAKKLKQPYKLELISLIEKTGSTDIIDAQNIKKQETRNKKQAKVTFYRTGDFIDLCRGGHVKNTGEIGPFKLLSVAGAYWRGSEKNPMLQRIYGTCWLTPKELDNYLLQLEEAKNRDHRKIGKELELYFIDDVVGKGLVMWLPKGVALRDKIEQLACQYEQKYGYQRVITPHLAREELYLTSGHLPFYKDSMFPPMVMDDGAYYLRAMNCPHHHRIYLLKPRSYKELPLRLAEYGTVYRNELSGTLAGLLRVRGLTMNDAHIYCTKDQIEQELLAVFELTQRYFKLFGLKDYWYRLSLWGPNNKDKYINEPKHWEDTEQIIRGVLKKLKVPFREVNDEAAFYGPKIDVQLKSVVGREETMSTIQLDFAAKKRFNLGYIDNNGRVSPEVFVIHRAPLSTHERFLAFLIEHYNGRFPFWLSPTQIKILSIASRHIDYAQKLMSDLAALDFRVELDDSTEMIGKKIRAAQVEKVPYMLVIGDKEMESNKIAIRHRDQGDMGVKTYIGLLNLLKGEENPFLSNLDIV